MSECHATGRSWGSGICHSQDTILQGHLEWARSVAALLLVWFGTSVDLTFRTAAPGTQQQVVFHHEDGSGVVEVYADRQNGHRTLGRIACSRKVGIALTSITSHVSRVLYRCCCTRLHTACLG